MKEGGGREEEGGREEGRRREEGRKNVGDTSKAGRRYALAMPIW